MSIGVTAMIERGRRDESRLRLRLPCRLITARFDRRAVLIDLSVSGARIQLEVRDAPHGDAVLQWHGYETFGSVVWARSNCCGLHFDHPVEESWLIATRQLSSAGLFGDERAAARALAREWVSGARRL